jgi:hypothetical protein
MRTTKSGGATPSRRYTIDDLRAHPPIRLDVSRSAERGLVRESFDAMRETPVYQALRAQAETRSDPRLDHAAGELARRSVSAHVARLIAGGDYSLSPIPF